MHVLLVDDHVMFLQGLKNLLGVLAPQLRVDTSGDVATALQLVQLANYDLVLLDWHLAECEGEAAIQVLREAGCMSRIVVLSGENNGVLIRKAVDVGAAGFIPKTYSAEMMVAALNQVLGGRVFLPTEPLHGGFATKSLSPPAAIPTCQASCPALTARQIDVYRAATRGLPNKLIARELGISESTVKTHLTAVYAALGVRNRTEAAYQASRDGHNTA